MQNILQEILRLISNASGAQSDMTVSEWLQVWYNTYKLPYRKSTTLSQLQARIDRYIIPAIGNVKLTEVTGMQLQTLLNGIRADNMRQKVAGILHDSFDRAVKNNMLLLNPFQSVEIPAHHSVHYRPLEFTEQTALLNSVSDRVKLSVLWVLACTGMRIGEFLALDFKQDISMSTNEILISKSMNTRTGEVTTPKTSNGIRRIPYTPRLISHLMRLREYSAKGGKFNYPMLRSYFRRKYDACGILHANLYSLRHTFVTMCHLAEIPVKFIQYWAGHSDIDLTLNTYTHVLRKGISPFFEYIKGLKKAVL